MYNCIVNKNTTKYIICRYMFDYRRTLEHKI